MSKHTLKRASAALLVTLVCVGAVFHERAGATASRQQQRAGRARSRPFVYLALGDSTGAGVGARGGGYVERLFRRIREARPGAQLINLCASAAATDEVQREQMTRVAEARPSLITVGVGANDLIRGAPAEKFARGLEEIVIRLRRETDAHIVLMNIPDISLAPAVPAYMRAGAQRHIALYNERIAELARRHSLLLVDLYGRSREFSLHPDFFSQDGLHPSDAGYDFWARLLWLDVKELLSATVLTNPGGSSGSRPAGANARRSRR